MIKGNYGIGAVSSALRDPLAVSRSTGCVKWVVEHKMWRKTKRPSKWDPKSSKLYVTRMFDSDHRGHTTTWFGR